MSQVFSAKLICERSLRAINAYPATDSAAQPEHLREAMYWLDLILAQNAGTNKLLFLVPSPETVQFNITNGVGNYDLAGALGGNAPVDGVQFPIAAYWQWPAVTGTLVTFGSSLPSSIVLGLLVTDTTDSANIPTGTTVIGINAAANQVTLSAPTTIEPGDSLQFASSPSPTTLTAGAVGSVTTYRRRPLEIVTRSTFMTARNPNEYGHPRMVYIDRLPDSQLYLHPYPAASDTGTYTLVLDVQTYAPNVAPAGVTGTQSQGEVLTNFRQAWQRYLVCQLAHDLGSGPIFKIGEASLNRFGAMAATAKAELEAFENREHDDEPPICAPMDHDYGYGGRERHDYVDEGIFGYY